MARVWPENEGHRPHPRNKPRSPADGSYRPPGGKSSCCTMAAAVRAARAGRPQLAARYARMSVRLILARIA